MIGALLLLQAGVLVATAAVWTLSRVAPGRPFPQRLAVLAIPLVFVGGSGPSERPFEAPAQIYAPLADHVTLRVAEARIDVPTGAATPPSDGWVIAWLLGALAVEAVRVRRLLRGSVVLRRVRGVELRVAPAIPSPCTLWLGRPIVLLDPDTAFSPTDLHIAVRHELQHHRAGDTHFAWILAGLGLVSPLARLLRRPLAEAEELACDRALLERGVDRDAYVDVLARLALRPAAPPLLATAMASAFLPRRITMLLRPVSGSPSIAAVVVFVALIAAPLTGWASGGLVDDQRLEPEAVGVATQGVAARGAFREVGHPRVAARLATMTGSPRFRAWLKDGLARSVELRPRFEAKLAAAGLPIDLAAVPLIESGYTNMRPEELSPKVPAWQRGAGYWMFIPTTARQYGLVVTDMRDDRYDIDKETTAAIALLSHTYARLGDWGLALAAYNQGEKAVDTALAKGPGTAMELAERGDLNDYVELVYAAAILMEDPGLL